MQQSTFAGARRRNDRYHFSLPQTQICICQDRDDFLAASVSFLQASRFQNNCRAARIARHLPARDLCVLDHSCSAFRLFRALPAIYLDAFCAIFVPRNCRATELLQAQSLSYFRQSIACLKDGTSAPKCPSCNLSIFNSLRRDPAATENIGRAPVLPAGFSLK